MKPNMKWWISLTVVACVMLTAALASAQQAQGLTAVGAPDPANGYPKWYIDRNGVQLAPCLVTPADDPCALAGTFPNPAAPIVFPTNFPDEFFYMRATARIDGIGGVGRADLGYALEGAFGGATGTAADGAGAQIVFARFRLRVTSGLVAGATYTMTSPYGTQSFVAAATGTINFTSDQGCAAAPCNFASLLTNTNVGPFVRWDPAASAPPAGFIGQPAIDHTIIGSPFNTNFFRLSGPNVGGPGVNTVETNLFSITGRLFVRPATTTTLASTPNPSTVGQAVTLTATVRPVAPATGVPTGTVTFRDGPTTVLGTATLGATGTASISVSTLAAGSHPLTAAYGGSLDFLASTSAAVTQVVNAAAPAPPPAGATDTVTIARAELAVAKGELRVEGSTTRLANGSFAASVEIHNGPAVGGACTGALIATTPVNAGSWAFRGTTTLRPTTVCVKSAGGGVASRAVTQK